MTSLPCIFGGNPSISLEVRPLWDKWSDGHTPVRPLWFDWVGDKKNTCWVTLLLCLAFGSLFTCKLQVEGNVSASQYDDSSNILLTDLPVWKNFSTQLILDNNDFTWRHLTGSGHTAVFRGVCQCVSVCASAGPEEAHGRGPDATHWSVDGADWRPGDVTCSMTCKHMTHKPAPRTPAPHSLHWFIISPRVSSSARLNHS